ncbi:MAG: hypothetical protein QM535_02105 [Limnohabitans sp.]|nr:hypothetical protein [Limnohabitans sp.]
MRFKKFVEENYKRFCFLEGSDYIASEFALETILKIILKFNVHSILEVGLGIGSISDTVLKFANKKAYKIEYFGTESNEFCLKKLPENVEHFSQIQLYSELKYIENKKFDFIIVDGYDNKISDVEKFCDSRAIIFIEGDRSEQTKSVLSIFPKSLYVNIATLKKNKPYAHGICEETHYVGGGRLIFTNPNFSMKLFWFLEKVNTFIIYFIRKTRIYFAKKN